MYICICMGVSMYTRMYVCTYVRMYVSMYLFMHLSIQEAANRGVTNGGVRPPGPNRPKWAQSVPNGPILNFPLFGPFSHKS